MIEDLVANDFAQSQARTSPNPSDQVLPLQDLDPREYPEAPMYPEDVSPDRRTGSPSITERMRLSARRSFASSPYSLRGRAHDNHDEESDRSRDGSQGGFGETIQRPPSIPEPLFLENTLKGLQHSVASEDQLAMAESVVQYLPHYSSNTIMAIISASKHLGEDSADPKARGVFCRVLEAAASNSSFPTSDRQKLFDLAKINTPASELYYQVRALRTLTKDGAILQPFANEFPSLLATMFRKQSEDTITVRKRHKGSQDRSKILPEERGLFALFELMSNTLGVNAEYFDDATLDTMLDDTIQMAEKTTSRRDMHKAVNVLRAVIEHTKVPNQRLQGCVEVMCAIASAIQELKSSSLDCILLLLHTPDRDEVVERLLKTLSLAPNERHAHTVGGALMVVTMLVLEDGDDDLPKVTFPQLIAALDEVHFANRRTRRDCLKALSTLVLEPKLRASILASNWDHIVKIILTATGDENYNHDKASVPVTIRATPSMSSQETQSEENPADRALADEIISLLHKLAMSFNPLWHDFTPVQRQALSLFYYKLRLILPKETLRSLIKQLSAEAYFDPETQDWQNHQLELIRLFVWDRDVDPGTHKAILNVLTSTLAIAPDHTYEHYHMLVLRLLNDYTVESSLAIANDLAEFAATTWRKYTPKRMGEILERFWPLLSIPDMTSDGHANPWGPEIKLNNVSLLFVKLFLDYLPHHQEQSIKLYEFMTEIAKASTLAPSVRIPVLRLLVRIRSDSIGRISVTEVSDSLDLAISLSRTEETIGAIGPYSLDRPGLQDGVLPPYSRSGNSFSARSSRDPGRVSRILPKPPLWMYPGAPGLPQDPPQESSKVLFIHSPERPGLKPGEWLIAVIDIMQQTANWEVYSYVVVHLPSQLSHPNLFAAEDACIKHLRSVLVSQLLNGKFQEPPAHTNVHKGDVALCLFQSLTMLLVYSDHFSRGEQDDIVRAFLAGLVGWERTSKVCIQSLAACCHHMPWSVSRSLAGIVQKMSQMITQSNLAVDILEFLGGVARLPDTWANFREDDFRTVFAVCIKYLEHAREQREKLPTNTTSDADYTSNRLSGISARSSSQSQSGQNIDLQRELPQYVFALAYHVITIWFLSLKLTHRPSYVGWIASNLAWKDSEGYEHMEEQSQVALDMMHRVSYLDLGESCPVVDFKASDGKVLKKSWLVGMSIMTIETAAGSGYSQIIKRQASGTTYASWRTHFKPLPPHHIPMRGDSASLLYGPDARINILPNHILLQLTSTIAPGPNILEPICLPDDDMIRRALSTFDRNDTVDGYKVGVVYVGNGQKDEAEILGNTAGSRAFELFLEALGTKVPLKDATFNTQGLDRAMEIDGTHTYAWRDRVAEMVFHVPTMMPTNLEHDPACVAKKRHIGNDFVNIIFNESGFNFKFDTFASEFNCVNIVIAPDDKPFPGDEEVQQYELGRSDEEIMKRFYTIQTVSHPTFPLISPAAIPKLLPLESIPNFARQIALQSSVFSNAWTQRAGGEVISSWRNRLREIQMLRDRFAEGNSSLSAKFPGAKGAKVYKEGDVFVGRVAMGGLVEEESGIIGALDFSRWTGTHPPLA